MKIEISELWETGRQILCDEGSDVSRPKDFSDLKKYENVLLGDKIPGTKMREAIIDNSVVFLSETKVRHPQGGTMYLIEVE